jgi:hypothetical protein
LSSIHANTIPIPFNITLSRKEKAVIRKFSKIKNEKLTFESRFKNRFSQFDLENSRLTYAQYLAADPSKNVMQYLHGIYNVVYPL